MQALKINEKLKALVKTERQVIAEILKLIQILDVTKSYRELGYSSLFDYLTSGLGYSEGSAQRRISSARLLKQVPSIATDLQSGSLNLTQVSLAQTAIAQQEKVTTQFKPEEKLKIIESLKHKNTFETKQILQKQLPDYDPTPKSQITPSNDKVQVALTFTQQEWHEIQELLARQSHKVPDQKIESLLLKLARSTASKVEAFQCATKVTSSSCAGSTEESSPQKPAKLPPLRKSFRRKCIPTGIKRYLFWKAEGRCQFVSPITNKACCSKHFLEIEHAVPLALGGTNDIENLRVYCREHNALAAKLMHLT